MDIVVALRRHRRWYMIEKQILEGLSCDCLEADWRSQKWCCWTFVQSAGDNASVFSSSLDYPTRMIVDPWNFMSVARFVRPVSNFVSSFVQLFHASRRKICAPFVSNDREYAYARVLSFLSFFQQVVVDLLVVERICWSLNYGRSNCKRKMMSLLFLKVYLDYALFHAPLFGVRFSSFFYPVLSHFIESLFANRVAVTR